MKVQVKDEVLDGFIGSAEFIALADSFGIEPGTVNNGTSSISPIVSVISGKQIIAYDSYGTVTSKFYSDGNYSESGNDIDTGPWSCSGKWKDLGSNKIGMTCEDNGTTLLPDGNIVNDDEIHIQFNTDTVSINDTLSVSADNELFNLIVTSFGGISNSSAKVTIPSSLSWLDWPSSMNDAVTSFSGLLSGFIDNGDYSFYTDSDSYDGIRILSNGNAVIGTPWENGLRATSTVIGSWTTSNDVIVITLNNGEIRYLRVVYKNGHYVIQNADS